MKLNNISKLISNKISHSISHKIYEVPLVLLGSSGGGTPIPALAIQDRSSGYILDRAGNYIESRV